MGVDSNTLSVLATVRDGLSAHIAKVRDYGLLSDELERLANLRSTVNAEIDRLTPPIAAETTAVEPRAVAPAAAEPAPAVSPVVPDPGPQHPHGML
ncbi:hypothetical protein [Singulisphaera sp. PoT]|uniref:hypothetical protein n=1 Tax=Singulisphaera sp. PoT TaxID=3411797 RepID=UPI003BF56E64